MICIFMILGKGLVSNDAAACTPGVKCFFVHYLGQNRRSCKREQTCIEIVSLIKASWPNYQ